MLVFSFVIEMIVLFFYCFMYIYFKPFHVQFYFSNRKSSDVLKFNVMLFLCYLWRHVEALGPETTGKGIPDYE